MNIILTGFQGVGKSYFGKKVADRCNRPFFDIDQELVKKHQAPHVRALYIRLGEEQFRHEEASILLGLLEYKESVIALGGGSLLSQKSQNSVKAGGKLIYLSLPFSELKSRLFERPLPAFLPTYEAFDALYQQRASLFTALSDEKIEIEDLDEEEIIERIIRCGCK